MSQRAFRLAIRATRLRPRTFRFATQFRPASTRNARLFATLPGSGADHQTRTPQEMINSVPVIEVDGDIAICDGGDPHLGHPVEYIQLNKVDPTQPSICGYCGLRFVRKPHH
mmetsp:Transcript_17046/g.19044  ORF Transcript_17046/g.19044 Transcript_17046/m.19044 type:complete len:112 (-) Transcript_17046:104-439(-)|eukprot:CAMPEP_0205825712 /NCGR_PEP_ID=MMETSP0206-20130828/26274_1 /ASSEMBLY_ACC=CAM_ASM_000279 /TAXON_ID=36767 /ORGANISM="Euplotes focardii, Strain TN1" /LENGTH=111 /DNA_ID=CAMNT_0053124985 /DNA_START=33 /DNA_END=368 /DNA_ORIENTATION=-